MSVDLSDLKTVDIDIGLDWALLVAYHRGKMESVKDSAIYSRYANLYKNCDVLIGYIAMTGCLLSWTVSLMVKLPTRH